MAVENQFYSTSENVWYSTADDIWYGAEVDEISEINLLYAVRRFYCTLTGSQDSKSDIEIPISSFQGRRRNGNPTFLSVVTHDITYADEIADRPNGEIYIEMAYVLNGVETEREEIIRASLASATGTAVEYHEGSKSQSIVLSGYKTEAWVPKNITLTGESYKRDSDNAFTFRFTDLNVYLHPGDTVTIGEDSFEPSQIIYSIAATNNGINATMELTE